MSHTNRNFLIAYFFLVALPVTGLFAILRSGRTLTAPASVDGAWKIEANLDDLAALGCVKSAASLQDSTLTISQSGKNLIVSLPDFAKASGAGTIEGNSLNANVLTGNTAAGCGQRTLALSATLDRKNTPKSLNGILSASDCDSCKQVAIRAVHMTPAVRAGVR